MGALRHIGDFLKKIDYHTSKDPEVVGRRFEDHVQSLFPEKMFTLLEKTHSYDTNKERYVQSSLDPDFVWKHNQTGDVFAVECKYRTPGSYDELNRLVWCNNDQLNRYRSFQIKRRIPVFIIIGLEKTYRDSYGDEHSRKFMFNIPLDDAKYTAFYSSYLKKFERDYHGNFYWLDKKLY